jgi:hypothetical protein
VQVESFAGGVDLKATLTRAKFESLNAREFEQCMDVVKVLAHAHRTPTGYASGIYSSWGLGRTMAWSNSIGAGRSLAVASWRGRRGAAVTCVAKPAARSHSVPALTELDWVSSGRGCSRTLGWARRRWTRWCWWAAARASP